MSIICGPQTATVGYISTLVCNKLVGIYNIQPTYPDRVDLILEGQYASAYSSGSALRRGNEIWTLFLLSKNVPAGTVDIKLTISSDPCTGIPCPDKCIGSDLWDYRCDPKYENLIPVGYECVQDILKQANSSLCLPPVPGATHRIEYDLSILPTSFLDLVASNIVSLSDVLGDFLPMPENIQYISSSYGSGKFSLYVKYTEPVTLGLQMSLSAFAGLIAGIIIFVLVSRITARLGPWGIAAAAVVAVAGAVITGFAIYDLATGLGTSGAAPARTPKDDLVAVSEYFKTYVAPFCDKQYPGCAVEPPTCDSAAMRVYLACKQQISLCQYAAAKAGSPITECDTRVQEYKVIDDGLLSGTLTPADAKNRSDANNTIINNYYTDTIKKVTCESGQVYDSKTQKCVAVSECWISGPIPGTCILSAKTGKTIAIVGGLVVGGIILISIFKK